MERKKCFVCLKESSEIREVSHVEENDISILDSDNDEETPVSVEIVEKCKTLDNQLQVIFVLRKFLKLPGDMCCKFLQDYGNPKDWIHCCESCLALVQDAKSVFDHIVLLKRKFEQLQQNFREAIVASVKSNSKSEEGVTETVRYYVTQGLEDDLASFSNHDFDSEDEEEEPLAFVESCLLTENDNDYVKLVKPENLQEESKSKISNVHHISTSANPFQCSVCSKEFSKSSHLKRHELIHTGEKPYCCDFCGKSFSDPSTHKRHVEVVHKKKKSTTMSPEKATPSTSNLRKGNSSVVELPEGKSKTNLEDDVYAYPCDLCDATFIAEDDLKRHFMIHACGKVLVCRFCEKIFSTSSHVKRHERIHTGEKPFSCETCGRRFSDSSTMRKHAKTHV